MYLAIATRLFCALQPLEPIAYTRFSRFCGGVAGSQGKLTVRYPEQPNPSLGFKSRQEFLKRRGSQFYLKRALRVSEKEVASLGILSVSLWRYKFEELRYAPVGVHASLGCG